MLSPSLYYPLLLQIDGQLVGQVDNHAEDVKVLRTVCQGQYFLHAVVVGIGRHWERYFLDTRTGRTVNPWLRM